MDDDLGFFRVAGVSYYQPALERCAVGQAVRFIHEPDNPHDEMALKVESLAGETIGYVPKGCWARTLVHEQGRGVSGVIASMGYSRNCLLGLTVSVAVCDDRPAVKSYYPGKAPPEAPRGGFRYWVRNPSDVARRAEERRRSA